MDDRRFNSRFSWALITELAKRSPYVVCESPNIRFKTNGREMGWGRTDLLSGRSFGTDPSS